MRWGIVGGIGVAVVASAIGLWVTGSKAPPRSSDNVGSQAVSQPRVNHKNCLSYASATAAGAAKCRPESQKYQVTLDGPSSMTVKELQGDAHQASAIGVGGVLHVQTSDCQYDSIGRTVCAAQVSGGLATGSFEFMDEDVASVYIQAGGTGEFVKEGLSATVDVEFSGTTQHSLDDGRYRKGKFKTGSLMLRWLPGEGQLSGEVAFVDKGEGIAVRFSGTLAGQLGNSTPIAIAEVGSVGNSGVVCLSDMPVVLSGEHSNDDDGDSLSYAWIKIIKRDGADRFFEVSRKAVYTISSLKVGDHRYSLTVNDKRGGSSSYAVSFELVDEEGAECKP